MEPFLGQVSIVGFNFPPRGWAYCDGQLLPIAQNQSLYSLLGTTYGGDGRTTYGLPDLRGRAPIHVGSSGGPAHRLGQKGGEAKHTLTVQEMPNHRHELQASASDADTPVPAGHVLARTTVADIYRSSATNLQDMKVGTVADVGFSYGHENMQPFITLGYVIALQGVYPSRK